MKDAADWYGVSVVGVRLTSDELMENYLIVLDIDGTNHFEVIKSINSTMVVLFDPNLGLIEMTREKFDELYTGVAMIFGMGAPTNATLLSQAEMESIKANGYMKRVAHSYWVLGYVYVTYKSKTVSYSLPYVYWVYVPGYTVRSWYTLWQTVHIPGHSEPRIGWRTYHYTFWYPVLHYVPPRKVTYYTYQYVPDVQVKNNWARVKFIAEIEATAISAIISPPTSIRAVVATVIGLSVSGWDIKDNYNAIFYGGPAMEAYVDGKLRMKQEWVSIEIFDNNGNRAYPPPNPWDDFYQKTSILPNFTY